MDFADFLTGKIATLPFIMLGKIKIFLLAVYEQETDLYAGCFACVFI